MTSSVIFKATVLVLVAGLAAGCANTIRGIGQDTASAVRATQQAGQEIEGATN